MEVYGFAPKTLFFLLSNDPVLPINPNGITQNTDGIPSYTFSDATSINFQYNFDNSAASMSYTAQTGYFNCPYQASPQYICNGKNYNNAMSS